MIFNMVFFYSIVINRENHISLVLALLKPFHATSTDFFEASPNTSCKAMQLLKF